MSSREHISLSVMVTPLSPLPLYSQSHGVTNSPKPASSSSPAAVLQVQLCFVFLPITGRSPPPVFHSPHMHWQPIHSPPHIATPNTRMRFWKDPFPSDREKHLIRSLKSRKLCLFWFWLSPPLCAVWFDNSMTGSLPTIDLLEQRDAGKEVWRCTVTVTEESSLWNTAYTCMRTVHPWFSTMTSVQTPEWLLFKRISLLKCILVSGFEEEFMDIFFILSGLWPEKPII